MLPLAEQRVFIKTWLTNPCQIGSITPSSRRLAAAMASAIPWDSVRTVVELGAGTGAITGQILAHKSEGTRFLVFERERRFRHLLQGRFPTLPVYSEAKGLAAVLWGSGIKTADAIVSGIPFALLGRPEREQLLDEIDRALAPGGTFVAFQYWPQLYPELRRRFATVRLRLVAANLPPAVVFCCQKRIGPASAAQPGPVWD